MNILILYPFYNQKGLMHNFSSKLGENGIFADVLCVGNYKYEKRCQIQWPKLIEKVVCFLSTLKEGCLKKVVRVIVYRYLLRNLFPLYDLIDFHAYYPTYNHLMRGCKNKKIKFDITLWGSDLMRANDERKKLLRYGFDNSYRIKLSDNLYDIMTEYYGNTYDTKCRIVYFGNSDLPVIDALTELETNSIKDKLYGGTNKKKIMVCGYNGNPSQNHLKMLDALSSLNVDEKNAIHIVLPMTYGASSDYLNKVRTQLECMAIPFTLLDRFLDSKEVAVIRKTADIVINVQNTDAISGSLQDHLYCGNVCIFGEWLNYSPYTNNNIYYIKTSMDGIAAHVRDVLSNYEYYHNKCEPSRKIIKELFSWETTLQKQVSVYGE